MYPDSLSCTSTIDKPGNLTGLFVLIASVLSIAASAAAAPFDNVREQLELHVRAAHPGARTISVAPARMTALSAMPDCDQPWVIDLQGQRLLGPVAIRAICPGTGRAVRLTVVVQVTVPTLVAAMPLARGSVLTVGQLQLQDLPVTHGVEPMTDPALLIGQRLRSALRAGQPLSSRLLEPELWVTTGDEVALTAGAGSVAVSVTAKALQDGHAGEQIRVRNLSSGRTVAAWVTGPGRTSTRLPAAPALPAIAHATSNEQLRP